MFKNGIVAPTTDGNRHLNKFLWNRCIWIVDSHRCCMNCHSDLPLETASMVVWSKTGIYHRFFMVVNIFFWNHDMHAGIVLSTELSSTYHLRLDVWKRSEKPSHSHTVTTTGFGSEGLMRQHHNDNERACVQYTYDWLCWCMMTSSNGSTSRVTGPLCGEFTGHRWIPLIKASNAKLWCFLWSAFE